MAQGDCTGCLQPITVNGKAYQSSYLSYSALYNPGFFTGLGSGKPNLVSRLLSVAKNHPFAALAAMATIAIGGGPEDPLTDALALVELSAAEGAATTSVFWSGQGTQVAADAWAAANGGTTLSKAASATEAEVTAASANFVAQASGNVVVFQNAVRGGTGRCAMGSNGIRRFDVESKCNWYLVQAH